ncbi:uncharacterized protein EI97DRAFT_472800 [Westerdykella ornata]|uniref:Galactose oxidase n=1 Tax=Westerdykella ornata TaxID=318751 RepID=A0A6A6JXQ4_WESOR|nr:uncharacterized protein EI97DRAFT_472800 [Westerdykella ornata]KAF2281401.1 hypothetical protein EI97DRAFT_472800 [Westerdykella ornata]
MRSRIRALRLFLAVSSCISRSEQRKDPLKDFCRIFGHQTTVVDRRMIVDGGLVNFAPLSASSLNYSSTWMRSGDLNNTNEGFPKYVTVTKNESVPSVHGGVLWADATNKQVYMYGGEFGDGQPQDFQLWFYDLEYDSWNTTSPSGSNVQRAAWGAGAGATDQAKAIGYYYGGYLTNASVPGYGAQTPLSNMVVYDMIENSFRNQSGPDNTPRAEGVMQYVPVGDAGLLVYFGGLEFPNGGSSRGPQEILVYSIGDDLWYRQTATGDIPEQRRRFCAGLAHAQDRSSFNIYLYGGASIGDGVGFGDVYVLSLPSFTWIKFWPRPEDGVGATFPHHSLSCDVVGNSQMIIMGGHFPNMTNDCDMPMVYGQHGLDLGKNNPLGAKWASYNPNLTTYQVPTEIARTIGGGPTGGATVTTPVAGFRERDLQVQFAREYNPSSRTPTRHLPLETGEPAPEPEGPSRRAVIGGAVGGSLGALLVVGGMGFFLFRRRLRNRVYGVQQLQSRDDQPVSEIPSHPRDRLRLYTNVPAQPIQHSHSQSQIQSSGSPPSEWSSQWGSPVPEYYGPSPQQGGQGDFSDTKHASLMQPPQELPPCPEPQELPCTGPKGTGLPCSPSPHVRSKSKSGTSNPVAARKASKSATSLPKS